MTSTQLATFALLLGAVAGVWMTLFYLVRLDNELERAFVQRLIFGSSFGWLLFLGSLLMRWKWRSDSVSMATPRNLAREYSAVSERVPIKGKRLVSLSH